MSREYMTASIPPPHTGRGVLRLLTIPDTGFLYEGLSVIPDYYGFVRLIFDRVLGPGPVIRAFANECGVRRPMVFSISSLERVDEVSHYVNGLVAAYDYGIACDTQSMEFIYRIEIKAQPRRPDGWVETTPVPRSMDDLVPTTVPAPVNVPAPPVTIRFPLPSLVSVPRPQRYLDI